MRAVIMSLTWVSLVCALAPAQPLEVRQLRETDGADERHFNELLEEMKANTKLADLKELTREFEEEQRHAARLNELTGAANQWKESSSTRPPFPSWMVRAVIMGMASLAWTWRRRNKDAEDTQPSPETKDGRPRAQPYAATSVSPPPAATPDVQEPAQAPAAAHRLTDDELKRLLARFQHFTNPQ